MDTELILPYLGRVLHILAAITLVGGTLFLRLAWVPATAVHDPGDQTRETMRESVRKGWARIVGIAALLILVSGFYNAYLKAVGYELSGAYLGMLTLKMVLAFLVLFLSARLSGRSEKAVAFREREKHWLNIICALMLVIVLLASAMKYSSAKAPVKIRDGQDLTATLSMGE